MTRRTILTIGAGATLAVAWAFIRPERAWLDSAVAQAIRDAVAPRSSRPYSGPSSGPAPAVLMEGSLRGLYRDGRGTATVYSFGDDWRELRFTGFAVDNGPDLYVYLVASTDVADDDTVERVGYVSLGRLKGNSGDQRYVIPIGADLDRYRALTIWCRRFNVSFAVAALERP